MLLGVHYNGVEIHRGEKIIYGRFTTPHRVISTCRAAGGINDDLTYVYNHQVCEPCGEHHNEQANAWEDPQTYRRVVCEAAGLPPDKSAGLATAANMNNAAISVRLFDDLTVVCVQTAGVEGNAGRAGDPAHYHEHDGRFESLLADEPPRHGTINAMLFINQELTHGAMVRAVVMAAEAKTAKLQELGINSRYSSGPATGTGTDQIVIASRLGGTPATSPTKHTKLGELIALAVMESLANTLAQQNELTPRGQCSCRIHLERLGADRQTFEDAVAANLEPELAQLFRQNYDAVNRDPVSVAAAAALMHLRDKLVWGVLPPETAPEALAAQAALLAAAVSAKHDLLPLYREKLAPQTGATDAEILAMACGAIAMGYADKWSIY